MRDWLERARAALSHVAPEAGAIAFVRYHHAINSTRLVERLRDEQSVLVVPGDHFDMDGYLRIGFGSDPTHLASSLERIGALLDTIRRLPMRADLALVGFGHVGRRFARLLEERRDALARDFDLDLPRRPASPPAGTAPSTTPRASTPWRRRR